MEQQANQPQVPRQQASQPQANVGFPQPPKKKSSFPKWILGVIGVLLIAIVGGFFLYQNYTGSAEPSPTPSVGGLSTFATPSPTQTPDVATPTPQPVDKSEISIQVLNGTGIAGEASFLSGELQELGYENIVAENADDQNETRTTVTYSERIGEAESEEITERLNEVYERVRTRRGDTGEYDIVIITGPRSGASASDDNAEEEEEAEATATPTASPTSSPSSQ